MAPFKNKKVVVKSYPTNELKKENFEVVEEPINANDLPEGQVLAKTLYYSVDPAFRLRLNEGGYSNSPSFPLGSSVIGIGISKIIQSKNPNFKEGDIISGFGIPTAEYAFLDPAMMTKVNPSSDLPLPVFNNALGFIGLAAYFGVLDFGKPQKNETFVVSAAAGAVGCLAGQIAKIYGCKVIGIAGSDEKVKFLKEKLHFDEGVNYKDLKGNTIRDSLAEAVKKVNPGVENPGIDIYFDNVGAETLDAVLTLLNQGARIISCGQLSHYDQGKAVDYGVKNLFNLIFKSARIEGFTVFTCAQRFPEAFQALTEWLKSGQLENIDDIVEGLDNFPEAFVGLFSGANIGKRTVHVADP